MKLYIFEVENWEREAFDKLSDTYDISFVRETLTADNAADYADAEGISTFIYSQLTRETLDALPHLGIIASRSTGVDHIDMDTCKERGIAVCNVPSYGRNTVAEHAFGLLLMISHRLEEAVDRTRKGDFSPRGLTGFDLRGKTIGVIGTGDIGKAAISIAAGFGMKILAFDIKPDTSAARELGFNYVDLDTLLENADVITVHLPSTPQTRDFIAEPQFAKMKPGAVLINTARGDIVNITALAKALAEGKLAAAGLDVLPGEAVVREDAEVLRSVYEQQPDLAALLADQVLLRMRNVVVTPHSAFNTREAIERILDATIHNLRRYAEGQPEKVTTG